MCIATTSLFNLGTQKIINCAQLRLIDALHPSYPGYQVILKTGDPCFLSLPWVFFTRTETKTQVITLAPI